MSVTAIDPRHYASDPAFNTFLEAHLSQELLRFTTAGSVDDGKSTLIGRLLHDTRSVYEDQLAAIKKSRVNRASNGHVDLSLLTDGLRAEREQGITIDVAYRYFSTSRRKFIIADTPGHEQYTRNMATGASTADAAIVLIDAAAFLKHGGLLPQSRRHTYIASLLGIPHVVAAVNKMDLVGYSEETFAKIRAEFNALAERLNLHSTTTIPLSALEGDNVVTPSVNTPWYEGPTLLEYLETVPLRQQLNHEEPLRFPVQLVQRPDRTFRGFSGQVARGTLSAGQRVIALPSRRTSTVKRIVTYDGDLRQASHPRSVTVELADEIDLSRGEMLIAAPEENSTSAQPSEPHISRRVRATVVWMHEEPLIPGRTYIAKHTTRTVRATAHAIRHRVDVNTLDHLTAPQLALNEIAEVEFETNLPLFYDAYSANRITGSLILVDGLTNATVGAAMLLAPETRSGNTKTAATPPAFLLIPNQPAAAERLVDALTARGHRAVVLDDPAIPDSALAAAARALELANTLAISARPLSHDVLSRLESAITGDILVAEDLDEARFLETYLEPTGAKA